MAQPENASAWILKQCKSPSIFAFGKALVQTFRTDIFIDYLEENARRRAGLRKA